MGGALQVAPGEVRHDPDLAQTGRRARAQRLQDPTARQRVDRAASRAGMSGRTWGMRHVWRSGCVPFQEDCTRQGERNAAENAEWQTSNG
jgi:hypothetical protein